MKRSVLVFVTLLLAVSAISQEKWDKIYFRDGHVQLMDIRREKEKEIRGFYPDVLEMQAVSKILISKIVYRDGREDIFPEPEVKVPEEKKKASVWGNAFSSGTMQIGLGAGLPLSEFKTYRIIPLWAAVDIGIVDLGRAGTVSGGVSFDFSKKGLGQSGGIMAEIQSLSIEAVAGYHFFVAKPVSITAKAGVGYGQTKIFYDGIELRHRFSSSFMIGAAYYVTPNIAFSLEGGYKNGPLLRLGAIVCFSL